MILVTGGAGFIGANFVLEWLRETGEPVVNLDKLTYAGNPANLASLQHDARHIFVKGDINDRVLVADLLKKHRPRAIVHFAAESHVDRSIHGPGGDEDHRASSGEEWDPIDLERCLLGMWTPGAWCMLTVPFSVTGRIASLSGSRRCTSALRKTTATSSAWWSFPGGRRGPRQR